MVTPMSRLDETRTPIDPRRALGRRPEAHALPRLLIDDSNLVDIPRSPTAGAPMYHERQHDSLNDHSPSSQQRSVSPEPSSPTSPAIRRFRLQSGKSKQNETSQKGVYETQKLLSHLLDRLVSRPAAPDLLARAVRSANDVRGNDRDTMRGKLRTLGQRIAGSAAHSGISTHHDEHDAYSPGLGHEDIRSGICYQSDHWDTSETYDLVEQTRGLLVLADKQGLNLFTSETEKQGASPQVEPMKRRGGRFASFAMPPHSPTRTLSPDSSIPGSAAESFSGRDLLQKLICVLASLLQVDCLYQTQSFRLLKPPNGLQAACLDIAAYVYEKGSLTVKVDVMEMVVEAFYAMAQSMLEKLCEWIEGRLEGLLKLLAQYRRGEASMDHSNQAKEDPFETDKVSKNVPKLNSSDDTSLLDAPTLSSGWIRYSPTSPTAPFFKDQGISGTPTLSGILSVHSATMETTPVLLKLASLVPRLLLAISEMVDLSSAKLTSLYRVHRLTSLVLTAKPDSCLDLLEIVAHAPERARRSAVDMLATFFPENIGHNVIACRPPLATYAAQLSKWETGSDTVPHGYSSSDHHFIPWRISVSDNPASSPFSTQCQACHNGVHGFCVKCTLCRELRHFHCYHHESGKQGFRYETGIIAASGALPAFVEVKFSPALPRLEELTLSTLRESSSNTTRIRIGSHDFRLVNLFTTALCWYCRLPLWGTASQAYSCLAGCQRLSHPACIVQAESLTTDQCKPGGLWDVSDSTSEGCHPFTIRQADLAASFRGECGALCLSADDTSSKSYDEVAVLYGATWTQYKLFNHGIQNGSIVVSDVQEEASESDILGMRQYLNLYEAYLRKNGAFTSSAANDFTHVVNGGVSLGQGYLFSERFLLYCTALFRAPAALGDPTSETMTDPVDKGNQSYEALALPVITQCLASDLNLHDPVIATIFLNQLRYNGLLNVSEGVLSVRDLPSPTTMVTFGLPLLMNTSPTIEILVSAIEMLLESVDLCSNEIGLSLAVNRAFPSLLCSPYALERVAGALIRWVFSEDEVIHTIVMEYASKHRRLPGVRDDERGNSSVQVYREDREALHRRYVLPWLTALADQDPTLYAQLAYNQCRAVDETASLVTTLPEEAAVELNGAPLTRKAYQIAATVLKRIADLGEAGLLFSAQLDLSLFWLEDLGALTDKDYVYRALPRLFKHICGDSEKQDDDIWSLFQNALTEGEDDLSRVCRYVRVLSVSTDRLRLLDGSLTCYSDLVIAASANATTASPADFARLACRIFVDIADRPSGLSLNEELALRLDVLKQTMLVILRAYGVDPADLATTSLAPGDMAEKQPISITRKRKATILPALVEMDEGLLLSVSSLLNQGICPPSLLLDFLWLLFSRAPFVANIGGFLHKQCFVLYPILWDQLDICEDRKSRTRVLLRLLAVNAAPMENIVKQQFHSGNRSRLRERLLRFVLDLADETLTASNLGWRRACVGLIVLFFESLLDHTDVDPDNLVILQGILPSQLRAVSRCFEEYLVQSSDERRLNLMSRLHRLRLVLPSWPVLSWEIVDDLLVETAAGISQMATAKIDATLSALNDAHSVRANVIAIGLDMLSAGVSISWSTCQRFQQHVTRTIARPWGLSSDHVKMLVLPALRSVLDAAHQIPASEQSVDSVGKGSRSMIVGTMFLPVVIDLGEVLLEKHDYLTKRALLDIHNSAFFKHDITPVLLPALGALQSVAEFCRDGEADENRLYGLSILQLAISRVERESLLRAIPVIFCIIAELLIRQTTSNGDALVIEQSQVLLRTIIKQFSRPGLFVQIFKNDALALSTSKDQMYLGKTFEILHKAERPGSEGPLRNGVVDIAIMDLPDVFRRNRQVLEQVLESFERFAKCVHGELSEEGAMAFGQFIIRLGKHVADWDMAEFDPNPILRSGAIVLGLVSSTSAVLLLHQVSTLLHLSLSRFSVGFDTVYQLLTTSEVIAENAKTQNTVHSVLVELSRTAVNGGVVSPITLDTLLRFAHIGTVSQSSKRSEANMRRTLSDSAAVCMAILSRSHPSLAIPDTSSEIIYSFLVQAGTVLISTEMVEPGTISKHLGSIMSEAVITQLNVFIYILLASLSEVMESGRERLVSLYPILARGISLCLRASADLLAVNDTAGVGAENLSVVFAVFRLALLAATDRMAVPQGSGLLAVDLSSSIQAEDTAAQHVDGLWSRIWSDWYRLVCLSLEPNCVNIPLRTITRTVFLDTVIFLHRIQSPILVRQNGALGHTLHKLHRASGTLVTEQGGSKMIKAEMAVREAGLDAGEVDYRGIIKNIEGDLMAAERLKTLRRTA